MKTRLTIAFRNLWRNKVRTALILLMVASGVAAITLFEGFAHNLLVKIEAVAINNQFGHVQVASNKLWNPDAGDLPKARLITPSPELLAKINGLPGLVSATGRLTFSGLVSNGDHSTSGMGIGFDTDHEVQLRDSLKILEGRTFSPNAKYEILLGPGLRQQLGAKVGQTMTLLTYTFDGAANALDAEVVGIFETGGQIFDESSFFIPLATAQRLMDTDSIERLVVRIKDTPKTTETLNTVAGWLPPELGARPWYQLAEFYRQVTDYMSVQNSIILWIIMLLGLLSIANTIGMSISERVGEIGTVRALGDRRGDVLFQFLLEGLLIGICGGIVGCALGLLAGQALTACHIMINPPGASIPVPIEVDVLPHAYLKAFLVTCVTALLATILPAYRASRLNIVEALKRNI